MRHEYTERSSSANPKTVSCRYPRHPPIPAGGRPPGEIAFLRPGGPFRRRQFPAEKHSYSLFFG